MPDAPDAPDDLHDDADAPSDDGSGLVPSTSSAAVGLRAPGSIATSRVPLVLAIPTTVVAFTMLALTAVAFVYWGIGALFMIAFAGPLTLVASKITAARYCPEVLIKLPKQPAKVPSEAVVVVHIKDEPLAFRTLFTRVIATAQLSDRGLMRRKLMEVQLLDVQDPPPEARWAWTVAEMFPGVIGRNRELVARITVRGCAPGLMPDVVVETELALR